MITNSQISFTDFRALNFVKVQQKGRVINCNPAKSYPCGKSCRSVKLSCKNPLEGQSKDFFSWMLQHGAKQANLATQGTKPKGLTKKRNKKIKQEQGQTLKNINLKDRNRFKELGAGKQGRVHLDKKKNTVIKEYFTKNPQWEKAKEAEDKFLRLLNNTGVTPKLIDSTDTLTSMELVKGKPLNIQNIDETSLRQIFNARKILHEKGIAHGDMHEDNIIVDTKGKIKLLDFGWASEDPEELLDELTGGEIDYSFSTIMELIGANNSGFPLKQRHREAQKWMEKEKSLSIKNIKAYYEYILDNKPLPSK